MQLVSVVPQLSWGVWSTLARSPEAGFGTDLPFGPPRVDPPRSGRPLGPICLRSVPPRFLTLRACIPLQMLWRVDQGEAANISGVPDPVLKGHLAQLLELLRLRRNDKVRRLTTSTPGCL